MVAILRRYQHLGIVVHVKPRKAASLRAYFPTNADRGIFLGRIRRIPSSLILDLIKCVRHISGRPTWTRLNPQSQT